MRVHTSDHLATLHGTLDRLQGASAGSPALDGLIAASLQNDLIVRHAGPRVPGRACWSSDLQAACALLPLDYDFSHGRRDGVCWAWLQPNDSWNPAFHESRHDHPGGSGLVVAATPALALACALVALHLRQLEKAVVEPIASGGPFPIGEGAPQMPVAALPTLTGGSCQ